MSKLHVFIDGSWLYKACGPGRVLASKMESTDQGVIINFEKLNNALIKHVQNVKPDCLKLGDLYLCTCVFSLPEDFDSWPDYHENISKDQIDQTRRGLRSRGKFVDGALAANYSDEAVYRPEIKSWILEKLINRQYQEKQVDASVVALLVRSAITNPNDYHCVVTGDSDMLPAIRVAYPHYSKNVFVGTTHPDELRAEHRQTAFSLGNFQFEIPAFYFQDHLADIVQGQYVYRCAHCYAVFVRPTPIPSRARPCCSACHAHRT